jgi:hypothetical protein
LLIAVADEAVLAVAEVEHEEDLAVDEEEAVGGLINEGVGVDEEHLEGVVVVPEEGPKS